MFANRSSNRTLRILITVIVCFSLFFSTVGPSYATAFIEAGDRSLRNLTPAPVSDNINRPRDYGTPGLRHPGITAPRSWHCPATCRIDPGTLGRKFPQSARPMRSASSTQMAPSPRKYRRSPASTSQAGSGCPLTTTWYQRTITALSTKTKPIILTSASATALPYASG